MKEALIVIGILIVVAVCYVTAIKDAYDDIDFDL